MLGGTGFAAGVARARRQRAERADVDRLVAALRELKALRDDGALTPEEFAAAKRKVLAG
jgi:ribosomal protein L19E